MLAKQTLARAGPLDFGNDGGSTLRDTRANRVRESARRRCCARFTFDDVERTLDLRGDDLLGFGRQNLLEDVAIAHRQSAHPSPAACAAPSPRMAGRGLG